MVGLDYDGKHHLIDRSQYVYDIGRAEHSRRFIVHRVRQAFARRRWAPPKSAPRS